MRSTESNTITTQNSILSLIAVSNASKAPAAQGNACCPAELLHAHHPLVQKLLLTSNLSTCNKIAIRVHWRGVVSLGCFPNWCLFVASQGGEHLHVASRWALGVCWYHCLGGTTVTAPTPLLSHGLYLGTGQRWRGRCGRLVPPGQGRAEPLNFTEVDEEGALGAIHAKKCIAGVGSPPGPHPLQRDKGTQMGLIHTPSSHIQSCP